MLRDSFRSEGLREGRTVDPTIRTRTETQCDDRTGDRQGNEQQPEPQVGRDRGAGSDRPRRLPPEEGRERARDGEIGAEIEPDEQRAKVWRRLGGEDHSRRKIVDDDGAEGADRRGLPAPAPGEEPSRPAPGAGERAESRGEDEQQREHPQVESRTEAPQRRRREPDREHRQRRVPEDEDKRRGCGDRRGAEPENEPRRGPACGSPVAEAVRRHEHRGGDRAGREPRRKHLQAERSAADRLPAQDEQVRQIRSRQQKRGGVRHEDRAVDERPLVERPPACCVNEDRRQEDD